MVHVLFHAFVTISKAMFVTFIKTLKIILSTHQQHIGKTKEILSYGRHNPPFNLHM